MWQEQLKVVMLLIWVGSSAVPTTVMLGAAAGRKFSRTEHCPEMDKGRWFESNPTHLAE